MLVFLLSLCMQLPFDQTLRNMKGCYFKHSIYGLSLCILVKTKCLFSSYLCASRLLLIKPSLIWKHLTIIIRIMAGLLSLSRLLPLNRMSWVQPLLLNLRQTESMRFVDVFGTCTQNSIKSIGAYKKKERVTWVVPFKICGLRIPKTGRETWDFRTETLC